MRADIYRNLRKHCWSVRECKTRRVVDHPLTVLLLDARFVVSAAGRERVRREHRKNVHAWVRGEILDGPLPSNLSNWTPVKYDPYKFDSFVTAEQEPIHEARFVFMDLRNDSPTRGVWARMFGVGDDRWDPSWEGHPDLDLDED